MERQSLSPMSIHFPRVKSVSDHMTSSHKSLVTGGALVFMLAGPSDSSNLSKDMAEDIDFGDGRS